MLSIVQSCQNAFMVVLITCKNEEDPIKSEGPRVATGLYVNFSDIPGHLIDPQTMLGSGRNSNSFEHLCMSSLPAKIKKIQSKMKAPDLPL